MTLYSGNVTIRYVVEADDPEDASDIIRDMVIDDYPNSDGFTVEEIKEIN